MIDKLQNSVNPSDIDFNDQRTAYIVEELNPRRAVNSNISKTPII